MENNQPERVNFIAREQSYHGNTIGALGLSGHKSRRAHFLPLIACHFHHVSPCYAYRYKLSSESDEAYVKRLAEELEAKIQELGPHTVAAFFAETSKFNFYHFPTKNNLFYILSCGSDKWLHSSSSRLFQSNARGMRSTWCFVCC